MIRKITLIFLAFMLMMTILVAFLINQYLNGWQKEQMHKIDQTAVSDLIASYESQKATAVTLLQGMADIIDVNPNQPFNEAKTLSKLAELCDLSNTCNEIAIADLAGRTFSGLTNGWIKGFSARKKQREWFLNIAEKGQTVSLSKPYKPVISPDYSIPMSVKLEQNDQLTGVLLVNVDLFGAFPNSGQPFLIITEEGSIISTDQGYRDWKGKNFYKLRPQLKHIDKAPYLYQIESGQWWSISKHKIAEGTYLLVFTAQDEIVETVGFFEYSIVSLLVIAAALSVLIIYLILSRELRILPALEEIIINMSKGHFPPVRVDKANNELDLVTDSLVRLQENIASVSTRSIQAMRALKDNQQSLMAVTDTNSANAHKEFSEVEQVSTAATEMAAAASEVNQSAKDAEVAAQNASSIISESADTLGRSATVGQNMMTSSQKSVDIVHELREYTEKISSVVEMITGISEQTNLLALNAAIEAARAGEQGRGFAVVADEVRALAEKTQRSTVDIQDVIKQLQDKSLSADSYMRGNAELVQDMLNINTDLEKAFQDIQTEIKRINEMNGMVASAAQEQSSVSQDISHRLEVLNEIVRSNVDNTDKTTAASQDIAEKTANIDHELSYFKC